MRLLVKESISFQHSGKGQNCSSIDFTAFTNNVDLSYLKGLTKHNNILLAKTFVAFDHNRLHVRTIKSRPTRALVPTTAIQQPTPIQTHRKSCRHQHHHRFGQLTNPPKGHSRRITFNNWSWFTGPHFTDANLLILIWRQLVRAQ